VARRLDEVDAAAVIACEISALDTFRKAKQRGWKTLLDAPSFHHAAQDRLHGFHEAPSLHRRILAVKNHEIALADHVLTVSELARETYLEAGVQPEKVHAVPLGADLARFQPGAEPPTSEAVTFLFAGASIHRKGFDLLVGAFGRVLGEAPSARLRVVGPRGELAQLTADLPPGAVVLTGPVPQEELAAELRRADCLVLPSRNDSYGMVVAESLASGTPVIVSEMVGAKDLVIEGVSGWTVPMEDVDALTSRMLRCAHDPEALRSMGSAARAAAETATWEAYQGRFARLVETLLAEPGR
jgi:glycosyltransferase involved in cell wall biosynthesis